MLLPRFKIFYPKDIHILEQFHVTVIGVCHIRIAHLILSPRLYVLQSFPDTFSYLEGGMIGFIIPVGH